MGSIDDERLRLVVEGHYLPNELCTGAPPHCTDLLCDPAGVLGDRRRWPSHVCYESFLRESTQRWACRTASGRFLSHHVRSVRSWPGWWPLPVGAHAAESAHIEACPDPLTRGLEDRKPPILVDIVPFGKEEALWALRVEKEGTALDLFGLADYRGKAGERRKNASVIKAGEVAYTLQGRDTDFIDLVHAAKLWWSQFRGLSIRGRPVNTGSWNSASEYTKALQSAVHRLQEQGDKVTQEAVARILDEDAICPGCTDRQIRRWSKQYGITWQAAKRL